MACKFIKLKHYENVWSEVKIKISFPKITIIMIDPHNVMGKQFGSCQLVSAEALFLVMCDPSMNEQ